MIRLLPSRYALSDQVQFAKPQSLQVFGGYFAIAASSERSKNAKNAAEAAAI